MALSAPTISATALALSSKDAMGFIKIKKALLNREELKMFLHGAKMHNFGPSYRRMP